MYAGISAPTGLVAKKASGLPYKSFLSTVRHCRRRDDGQRGRRSPGHPQVLGQNGPGQDLGQEDSSAAGQGQAETCRRNPG